MTDRRSDRENSANAANILRAKARDLRRQADRCDEAADKFRFFSDPGGAAFEAQVREYYGEEPRGSFTSHKQGFE